MKTGERVQVEGSKCKDPTAGVGLDLRPQRPVCSELSESGLRAGRSGGRGAGVA